MNAHTITAEQIARYGEHLREEERAPGTVENYLRNVDRFVFWLAGRAVTREKAVEWKEHLVSCRYAPATINGMLSALNSFFSYFGWQECRVKALRVQRRAFRDPSRELTREEYEHLIETARLLGRERLALVLETIGATGVRVSEVRYLTVEAARSGRAEISLKGKIRTILLPGKLCRKLLKYARKEKIASGEVFRTGGSKSLSRKQIWSEMKNLCHHAGVEPSKVFPHNLRHLFATVFYRACGDIVKLADVLGHSSIKTTRIYLLTSGAEHIRTLDRLRLVC